MPLTRTRTVGHVLAERRKGPVTWQARIAADRSRLEVVGIVAASASSTTFEPLSPRELQELLEGDALEREAEQTVGRAQVPDGRRSGVIVRWIAGPGYGFIRLDVDGGDVFAHVTALTPQRTPAIGARVRCELGEDRRGRPIALRVRVLEADE